MAKTYWIFPTMSSSFSWRDCTTSKLKGQIAKHLRIRELVQSILWCPLVLFIEFFVPNNTENLPFHGSHRIYKDIPMNVHRMGLMKNWVFILQTKTIQYNTRKYNLVTISAKPLVNIKNKQRSRCENLKAWWLWWQIQGQINNLLVQLYQPAEDWSLDCSQWPIC